MKFNVNDNLLITPSKYINGKWHNEIAKIIRLFQIGNSKVYVLRLSNTTLCFNETELKQFAKVIT